MRGPLVLVVLRGWPGYQCPFCTRQFGDYRLNAQKFAERGTPVYSFTRARAAASELTRRRSRPTEPCRLALGSCSIPTIRSLRCMGCAGMRRTKPRTRQHSCSTRMASSHSRRSVTITATAFQLTRYEGPRGQAALTRSVWTVRRLGLITSLMPRIREQGRHSSSRASRPWHIQLLRRHDSREGGMIVDVALRHVLHAAAIEIVRRCNLLEAIAFPVRHPSLVLLLDLRRDGRRRTTTGVELEKLSLRGDCISRRFLSRLREGHGGALHRAIIPPSRLSVSSQKLNVPRCETLLTMNANLARGFGA